MLYGYGGQILRIDLTSGQIEKSPTPVDMAREYLGGRGFVAKLLWDNLKPGTKPFSPDNSLIMASGPLSGVFMPGSGKFHFGAKSPATGGYGDSNVGGHLAPTLKYAGYDAVVVLGKASEPTLLVIDDDKVDLRPARHLWGKGAIEGEKILKDELGEDFQIAIIGPAGENLVYYACISHDFGRQAGRTGVGAVMGSKNLKAVAIRGSKAIPLAEPKKVLRKGREMYEACFEKPGFKEWTPQGTAGVTDWVNEVGSFPTRNFRTGYYEKHKEINGQALLDRLVITHKGCFGCPIPCGKYSKTRHAGKEAFVEGPEYETVALFGGNCCLNTIEEVAYANYIADELGIDSISGGNVAAFAIECFENGIITEEQVGRKLDWNDVDSVVHILELVARRQGVGDTLANGVKYAAQQWGKGSDRFAIHCKGLEYSGYEPRYAPAMMLSYMTADVGAHHNRSWAITFDVAVGREKLEGKAAKVIDLQHTRPLFDALGICRLQWVEIAFELSHYPEIFRLVTGVDYSWEQLLGISERIWNLTRSFNVREIPDFGRAHDYPPPRLAEEPIPSGPAMGKYIPREGLDYLLDDYYRLRGWDSNGRPTRTKLQELGLGYVADQLGSAIK